MLVGEFGSAVVGTELIGTSITTNGDGYEVGSEPDPIRDLNPHLIFHDERRGGGAVELAVARRVADLDEQFRVALHVDIAAAEIGKLHGAAGPRGLHGAEREAGTGTGRGWGGFG